MTIDELRRLEEQAKFRVADDDPHLLDQLLTVLPALLDIAEAAQEVDACVDPDVPEGWELLRKLSDALAALEEA